MARLTSVSLWTCKVCGVVFSRNFRDSTGCRVCGVSMEVSELIVSETIDGLVLTLKDAEHEPE